MNWEAIGSLAEALGALAVLATLIYLAIQIKHIKTQNDSNALHHLTDGFKDFTGRISESEDLASIVTRGRESYSSLSEEDRLRFEYIYLSLLNTLESWYMVTSHGMLEATEAELLENLREAIVYYCDNSGFRELWIGAKPMFPFIAGFVEQVLEDARDDA